MSSDEVDASHLRDLDLERGVVRAVDLP